MTPADRRAVALRVLKERVAEAGLVLVVGDSSTVMYNGSVSMTCTIIVPAGDIEETHISDGRAR